MKYSGQTRLLFAVDCIIFGFDGKNYKILLIQRGMAPEIKKWSLMGGFAKPDENMDEAADRILKNLTGLEQVFMEQMYAFSRPERDPVERTISLTYVALIDINKYQQQISEDFHAKWFPLTGAPQLIFDHNEIVEKAKKWLRYKAAFHPILFELLPPKFTLSQLLALYEDLYETSFDKPNFSRKVLSSGLLIKQKEKEKESSKKGAFYYKLHKRKYQEGMKTILNFVSKPENIF